jgi:ATP-dependent Clp protease ATP-binding subunit ClpC
MNAQFSSRVKDILVYSKEEAIRLGNSHISPEHLFLGILRDGESSAIEILLSQGIDLRVLKSSIEKSIKAEVPVFVTNQELIPLLRSSERILKLVYLEAKSLKSDTIETEHLLLAILKDDSALVTRYLTELDITYQSIRRTLETEPPTAKVDFPKEDDDERQGTGGGASKGQSTTTSKSSSETPVLDNFGIDLTKGAEEGRLDPVVGREREIERLVQILSRRKKNNPVLIGEPGVGKSAIAEGLALRRVNKNVSRALFNRRVVTLDLASIVAGTKYRGQFEERMKAILNELSKNDNIILFIDEIHTVVGAGGASGSLDAANMMKPALARGEIQCIGATTLNEYR